MSGQAAKVKPAGCLQKLSHKIESKMNAFFSRLGELVAVHPGKTVLLALIGEITGGDASRRKIGRREGGGERGFLEGYSTVLKKHRKQEWRRRKLARETNSDGGCSRTIETEDTAG